MKDKRQIIVVAVLVGLLLIGGGYYLLFANKSAKPAPVQQQVEEEVVPTIAIDDLGLEFTARSDGKAVRFSIDNIKDIQSVDYELSYMAKGNLPRGAIGSLDVKSSQTVLKSDYIELGSCSSGKCKYDEGVSSIKLILKITKADGKTYQAEKTLEL